VNVCVGITDYVDRSTYSLENGMPMMPATGTPLKEIPKSTVTAYMRVCSCEPEWRNWVSLRAARRARPHLINATCKLFCRIQGIHLAREKRVRWGEDGTFRCMKREAPSEGSGGTSINRRIPKGKSPLRAPRASCRESLIHRREGRFERRL
jgi:hypothetical protein